jgi:hypothetical protein
MQTNINVPYTDCEGNIIVPKSVRPIIDYKETYLGNKKGAKRQFRYGNLHIREYSDHYTVHIDKIDPRKDPVGHLLADAPEFLIGIMSAISVGKRVGYAVRDRRRRSAAAEGSKNKGTDLFEGISEGCTAGSVAGITAYIISNIIKKVIGL